MRITILATLAVLITLFSFNTFALASFEAVSPTLSQSIAQADVIVEARIINFTATGKVNSAVDEDQRFLYQAHLLLKPSGIYKFEVLKRLRGQAANTFQMELPYLSAESYDSASLFFEPGRKVLLLLRSNSDKLVPFDDKIPMLPLADTAQELPELMPVEAQIVHLLLASLSELNLRKCNACLLRQTIDPQIPSGMVAYINEPDLRTRDAVLYCLGTNQQVAVIPHIVDLVIELEHRGQGSESITSLANFTTIEAVPYLNPLVFSTDHQVRSESMYSLYNLADATSIPYLILALHDPDPSQNISAAATVALHRLIPALGPSPLQSQDDYIKHRQEETKPIYQWWSDELEGQHLTKDEQAKLATQTVLPLTANELHLMLWNPSVELRRRVMDVLIPHADQSSIPYLMLALQDPDNAVAYGAYKTLNRLIGTTGLAADKANFDLSREADSQPLYKWWGEYLGPKPVSIRIPDSTGFIRLPDGK